MKETEIVLYILEASKGITIIMHKREEKIKLTDRQETMEKQLLRFIKNYLYGI